MTGFVVHMPIPMVYIYIPVKMKVETVMIFFVSLFDE